MGKLLEKSLGTMAGSIGGQFSIKLALVARKTDSNSRLLYNTLQNPHVSTVTLAFAFVTLTPNIFAFARISTLFFDDTECDILELVSIR